MGLRVLHSEAQNAVGIIDERLVAFVRSGQLTAGALDVIESNLHALRERHRPTSLGPGAPVALLAVVPARAGLSDKDLVERQRQLMKQLKADAKSALGTAAPTFVALTIVGDGPMSSAMRAVIRVNVLGHGSIHLAAETAEAASWLAPRLSMDAAAILRQCQELERTIEPSRSAGPPRP